MNESVKDFTEVPPVFLAGLCTKQSDYKLPAKPFGRGRWTMRYYKQAIQQYSKKRSLAARTTILASGPNTGLFIQLIDEPTEDLRARA